MTRNGPLKCGDIILTFKWAKDLQDQRKIIRIKILPSEKNSVKSKFSPQKNKQTPENK